MQDPTQFLGSLLAVLGALGFLILAGFSAAFLAAFSAFLASQAAVLSDWLALHFSTWAASQEVAFSQGIAFSAVAAASSLAGSAAAFLLQGHDHAEALIAETNKTVKTNSANFFIVILSL